MRTNREYVCARRSVGLMLAVGWLIVGVACEDEAGSIPGTGGESSTTATNMPAGAGGSSTTGGGRAGSGVTATGGTEGNPPVGGGLGGRGGATTGGAGGDDCPTGDSDFDNISDCVDGCPADSLKTAPGLCGCGQPETDIDADGALDCLDLCPVDVGKTEPGLCGCAQPDRDSDADGALDCDEDCPFDAARQAPGLCGCGAPDTLDLCLRHRYSFDEAGAVAIDSAGAADGAVVNTMLAGDGTLVLAGGITDQYVDLPDGIISALGSDATIEVWASWTGAGAPWQRIFDFGNSDQPPGEQGIGVTYLFVTPSNTLNTHLRAAYTIAGPPAERSVNAPTALRFPGPSHVAVVIDGTAATMTMYQDGALIETAPTLDTTLALLNDVNNWIGRSQFAPDDEFQGTIEELRIYSVPRTAEQIAAEVELGPDELPEQ